MPAQKVSIATFNMNLGKGDWDHLLDSQNPDIVLAQESHDPKTQFRTLFDTPGGHVIWQELPDAGRGSAIFCRSGKLTEVPLPDFVGQVLVAETTPVPWSVAPHAPLRIACICAGKAAKGGYAARVHAILDLLANSEHDGDLIVGGDFNLTVSERHPEEELTTHPADLEIQHRLRDKFGLLNCWQTAHPNEHLAQTLRYVKNRTIPYHIDGLFVPQSWQSRLMSCGVLRSEKWEQLSDHLPVVARFRTENE